MNTFTNAVREMTDVTYTQNGAVAMRSTDSKVLDMYGILGAMRNRLNEVEDYYSRAWNENPDLAGKLAFHARDIRVGGLGEREVSRRIFKWIATYHPETMKANLALVPYYGRFDDWYVFVGTPVEEDMWKLFRKQWHEDVVNYKAGKPISLLAKWAKSPNTSSKESCRLGRLTAQKLGMNTHTYQKSLALLRKYINLTERDMSDNNWSGISYEAVPSKAMTNYRHAFKEHDGERFGAYINQVKVGEKKINASTLYPYDLTEKYLDDTQLYRVYSGKFNCGIDSKIDDVVEAQWKALPNYIEGEQNILVMADTSGSMRGRPMASALGLAVYFAERNQGAWHNLFMTFSERPEFVQLDEGSLHSKLSTAVKANWGMNTDMQAAFELVLKTAVENNVPASDMPKALIVVSDMQFDVYDGGYGYGNTSPFGRKNCKNIVEAMRRKFAQYGYELPNIVFWTVNSFESNPTYQNKFNTDGVQNVSGQSAATFKRVIDAIGYNAYEAMVKTLMSEAYAPVKYVS